jgi:hypothetical protein
VNLRRDHWRQSTSVRGSRSGRPRGRPGRGSREPNETKRNRNQRGALRLGRGGPSPVLCFRSVERPRRASRATRPGLRDEREKATASSARREATRGVRAPRRLEGKPEPSRPLRGTDGDASTGRRARVLGYDRKKGAFASTRPTGGRRPAKEKKKRLSTMDTSGLPTTKDAARCDK